MNPGFIIINNGTNENENEEIRQTLRLAKKNIESNFQNRHYLETFIQLLTKESINDDWYIYCEQVVRRIVNDKILKNGNERS